MSVSDGSDDMVIRLRIRLVEPLAGTVVTEDGAERMFSGWTGDRHWSEGARSTHNLSPPPISSDVSTHSVEPGSSVSITR